MIAFLSGTVAAVLPPQTAYIDVAGVGYAVAMPGGDLGKLAVGDTARVLTYLSVTENGIALFGFLSEEEKVLFEKLIGVSKVGPKMALAALSTFSPAELADAIASQDIARVSHIPGVGKHSRARWMPAWSRCSARALPSPRAARRRRGLPRRCFPWASPPPRPKWP